MKNALILQNVPIVYYWGPNSDDCVVNREGTLLQGGHSSCTANPTIFHYIFQYFLWKFQYNRLYANNRKTVNLGMEITIKIRKGKRKLLVFCDAVCQVSVPQMSFKTVLNYYQKMDCKQHLLLPQNSFQTVFYIIILMVSNSD